MTSRAITVCLGLFTIGTFAVRRGWLGDAVAILTQSRIVRVR